MNAPEVKAAGEAPGNPANKPPLRVTEATRRPMSLPDLKLQIPEIPGYYLYWFTDELIEGALAAGYEFVDHEEVMVTNTGIANDLEQHGSTDLGSRVSVVAGGTVRGTVQAQRLYLMKLRQEWRDKDVQKLAEVNEKIAIALRSGGQGLTNANAPDERPEDRGKRYLKQGQDMFYPRQTRKG